MKPYQLNSKFEKADEEIDHITRNYRLQVTPRIKNGIIYD